MFIRWNSSCTRTKTSREAEKHVTSQAQHHHIPRIADTKLLIEIKILNTLRKRAANIRTPSQNILSNLKTRYCSPQHGLAHVLIPPLCFLPHSTGRKEEVKEKKKQPTQSSPPQGLPDMYIPAPPHHAREEKHARATHAHTEIHPLPHITHLSQAPHSIRLYLHAPPASYEHSRAEHSRVEQRGSSRSIKTLDACPPLFFPDIR